MSRVLIGSLVLLLAAGAVLLGIVLQSHSIAGASGHSAERSFESPWVVPEGELRVTIAVQDYGAFAQVQETLPEGFSFVGSSLPEVAVKVDSGTLTFTLLGENEFEYTVQAPAVEGTYSFSGIIKDQNKTEEDIGGDSSLRVGPEPTPTPTASARHRRQLLHLRWSLRRSLLLNPRRRPRRDRFPPLRLSQRLSPLLRVNALANPGSDPNHSIHP